MATGAAGRRRQHDFRPTQAETPPKAKAAWLQAMAAKLASARGQALYAAIDSPMAQEKALQVLAGLAEHAPRGGPRPHQVAHRFVGGIRHPHGCQLAGAVQPGQRGGIAAIGLHPVAGPARDQRGRNHPAVLAEPGQQAMDALAARSGLVAEAELPVAALQARDQAMQRLRAARDLAQKADFTAAARLGDRHRRGPLVDVQSHERGKLRAARLLCLRLGASQSGATLDHGIPETGPFRGPRT